jgi:hypothetical protein
VVGLVVVPLQAAAWLVRGLLFQFMGLSALAAHQAHRRFSAIDEATGDAVEGLTGSWSFAVSAGPSGFFSAEGGHGVHRVGAECDAEQLRRLKAASRHERCREVRRSSWRARHHRRASPETGAGGAAGPGAATAAAPPVTAVPTRVAPLTR